MLGSGGEHQPNGETQHVAQKDRQHHLGVATHVPDTGPAIREWFARLCDGLPDGQVRKVVWSLLLGQLGAGQVLSDKADAEILCLHR